MGAAVPVLFPELQSPVTLLLMMVLGMIGGMAWAAIPAFLKNRFGANEILTSLMLVYVVQFMLDWLVRGPWRDPQGYNFPKTVSFTGWQTLPSFEVLPRSIGPLYVNLGAVFAVVAVIALAVLMGTHAERLRDCACRALRPAPAVSQASRAPRPCGSASCCRARWRGLPASAR